ncbi:putative ubiquitinyl hydrolase 1 [Helianthus anomalus]
MENSKIGLVSHMGTLTQCGHYVAYMYKRRKWVIFNEDKVGGVWPASFQLIS